jgi:hypothetical protein
MKKYKDTIITIWIFIIAPVVLVIGLSKLPTENKTPINGIPHNYWVPSNDALELRPEDFNLDSIEEYDCMEMDILDSKEEVDWTETSQGE